MVFAYFTLLGCEFASKKAILIVEAGKMLFRNFGILAAGVFTLALGTAPSLAGVLPVPETEIRQVSGPINTILGNGATVDEQQTDVIEETTFLGATLSTELLSSEIQYTITNTGASNPRDSIIGFAIDFGLIGDLPGPFAFTGRGNWDATVLSAAQWDDGFNSLFGFATGAGGIGTFETFFGSDALQAAVFFDELGTTDILVPVFEGEIQVGLIPVTIDLSNPILAGETDDRFFVDFGGLESSVVAICTGGVLCGQEVPEPGSMATFVIGVAGLGWFVRRRRRLAA